MVADEAAAEVPGMVPARPRQSWSSPWQATWGKGKGGGKGKGKAKGLRSFPMDKKVWIGGLPAESTSRELNKQLQEHMNQAGTCKWAEVGKSGAGGAAYATAEEAQNAIATLNGTEFNGAVIEVDVWTKKEKEE